MSKLEDLFNRAHVEEIEKSKVTSKPSLKNDPRLIRFKPGNTFRFRLLLTGTEERTQAWINKYTHVYYNKESSNRLSYVVCPTSEYMDGRNGFNKCPVCEQTNKWYKEGESGSQSSRDLYKMFKRQFNGFVPVYVINDPVNEENNGTVKIMRYGAGIRTYLKAKIHGVKDKDNSIIEGADAIGIEAFKLKQGRDLIITVSEKEVVENGKKRVWPQYDCEFASKVSDIKLTEKQLEKEVKELNFDKDFYETSTVEQRQAFYKEFVLMEDVKTDVDETILEETTDVTDVKVEDVDKIVEEEIKPTEKEPDVEEDGLDDIDDLLKDLEDI